ncbi:MAG: tRNA guanosine(34) transglycosylase Tgt [Candidatus Binatia bacterium]
MVRLRITARTADGARRARLLTAHGEVQTPAFMPVGTAATVKAVTPRQLVEAGTEIVLANTYHLHVGPGVKGIAALGGLHRFMAWEGPILTDSGGYQIFSLASNVTISERGARFRSHIDGSAIELTPEGVAKLQRDLGVDIAMAFDVLCGGKDERSTVAAAMGRTLRWAGRTRESPHTEVDRTFAIMQGGLFEDLRRECAERLVELDFPGYAVGGLSVGEEKEATMRVAEFSVGLLPWEKPRYMMGMGTPPDLVRLCGWGYDLFDCVIPTRNGRNATLYSRGGKIAIRNARFANDAEPVEEGCDCYTCRHFSRAYLNHLARRKEILGSTLATIHNVYFYQRLMADIRKAIEDDDYVNFSREFMRRYKGDD